MQFAGPLSAPCGTISPPILLKRDRRSVRNRKPSSSMRAMSPGVVPAVAQYLGGFFGYAQVTLHHVRSLTSKSPDSPAASGAPVSGTTIFKVLN